MYSLIEEYSSFILPTTFLYTHIEHSLELVV